MPAAALSSPVGGGRRHRGSRGHHWTPHQVSSAVPAGGPLPPPLPPHPSPPPPSPGYPAWPRATDIAAHDSRRPGADDRRLHGADGVPATDAVSSVWMSSRRRRHAASRTQHKGEHKFAPPQRVRCHAGCIPSYRSLSAKLLTHHAVTTLVPTATHIILEQRKSQRRGLPKPASPPPVIPYFDSPRTSVCCRGQPAHGGRNDAAKSTKLKHSRYNPSPDSSLLQTHTPHPPYDPHHPTQLEIHFWDTSCPNVP